MLVLYNPADCSNFSKWFEEFILNPTLDFLLATKPCFSASGYSHREFQCLLLDDGLHKVCMPSAIMPTAVETKVRGSRQASSCAWVVVLSDFRKTKSLSALTCERCGFLILTFVTVLNYQ